MKMNPGEEYDEDLFISFLHVPWNYTPLGFILLGMLLMFLDFLLYTRVMIELCLCAI